jgi:anti-anti-sigma regulatory factor
MVRLELNAERSLLTLSFRGQVSPSELQQTRPEILAALKQLTPGFRLLTDLSELDSMDFACAQEIETWMDWLRRKGVALVVRVVPDARKDIGFKIMSYFHYGRQVPVLTFGTRAEALARLQSE